MANYECENRISDDEIISSLEVIATTRNCNECKIRNCKWGTCNCSQITANTALDLINRQKAEIENAKAKIKICAEVIKRQDTEIERLKTAFENSQKTSKYWHEKCGELVEEVQTAQSEAYKEFAERLKQKSEYYENGQGWEGRICYEDDIDKLLKEMVGDTE